ncbi:DUF6230 family protein [Streptomyces sp. NPDC097619]|uniref:DUF6230 family protein n=1 Tax=Streptomyces sp. NPDC097619 TaxID=3157228 RepID=UPI003332E1F5
MSTKPHPPRAERRPRRPGPGEGRVHWKKAACAAVPALVVAAGMALMTAQGALAASFAVSGTTFQVSSGRLTADGLSSYVTTDRSVDGRGRPAALLGLGDAVLSDICQSARIATPVGRVVFRLTAGGPAGEVTASSLIIDGEDLTGDARFGSAEIGRDASTLDRVPGIAGEAGKFGLQAGRVEVTGVRSNAWAATGGNFRLKGLRVEVGLNGRTCF